MRKQKDSTKGITPAKGITIISKLRISHHENMEKLLIVWVKEKQFQGDISAQNVISENARVIYSYFLKHTTHTSTEDLFIASGGWLCNFKKWNVHSVVKHGEAASSDIMAAEDYLKTFSELIEAKGYIPQQVFNCHEPGLLW